MKVMVLGATGMAGHVIARYLREQGHEVLPHRGRAHIDLSRGFDALEAWVRECEPDVIINCVGVLVRLSAENPCLAEQLNGKLPHALAAMGPRLFHLSTDCVFSGTRGGYTEEDEPDELKVYGSTKAMGDVRSTSHCTVRVSIIGPEISRGTGLFAWAKSEAGNKISGYTNAMWNGITTLELAKFADRFISDASVCGLLHLRSKHVVSKFELLQHISDIHDLGLQVEKFALPERIDKSLSTVRGDIGYDQTPIEEQLKELRSWYLN